MKHRAVNDRAKRGINIKFRRELGINIDIPFNVIKPSPNDWGTCLCAKCLNPELKLEALAKALSDKSLKWDDQQDYNTIDELIKKINEIKYDKNKTKT